MTDKLIQYITGKELIERWEMSSAKFYQLCDGHIQAYKFQQPKMTWGEKLHVPGSVKIGKKIILEPYCPADHGCVMTSLFLLTDIEKFEQGALHNIRKMAQNKEIPPQDKTVPNGIVIDGTAPEYLRIAAEAWERLYKSGVYLKWKGGHIKNIIAWVQKEYPNIDPTPAKMIAKIINPNKNGGAPRMG